MSFKCLHIADIHFRGLSRHKEYQRSFQNLFKKAEELKPDIIYVGGDIVHSKTQGISPELIDVLAWWFTGLANIAPVHVILGNHDGLVLNKDRQDAISPIIEALNNPNIFLYKESGTYPTGIPGYNWCVFSCFDEEGWENVTPVENEINIALFHGAVWGSKTDIDWDIEGDIEHTFFEDYDFAFLGDIHKHQYLDDEKRIAYCGSTIQQNYGEDPGKGFLFWEIENKDEFTSKFYEVEHSKPFITIPWRGDVATTLDEAECAPDGARFRIKLEEQIPQAEIKQLYSALKEFKSATEVVLKQDFDSDVGIIETPAGSFLIEDLRDSKTHQKLMRQYYSNATITSEEWDELDKLTDNYVAKVIRDETSVRNIKWSIKKLEFDNTFAYGKGNVINFDNMGGITGLFGKNRLGKSSIPGTIMYGLFNTTDRGSIKNLHIINSRKGHCVVKITFNVNGRNYRMERQSVKHQTRKGDLHAVTHLNLYRVDGNGEEIQDLTEEQRRETEKVLRKLVGTADDFLLTSLASQGEMASFIKHRATKRKEILTNFLDLGVFDRMSVLAKEDSAAIKGNLKSAPEGEWDTLINEKKMQRTARTRKREEVEKRLSKFRQRLQHLKIVLATHKDKDLVTISDVREQERKINTSSDRLTALQERESQFITESQTLSERAVKIEEIKKQFPMDELREKLAAQQSLEKNLNEMQHTYEKERLLLKNQKKSVSRLDEVPCGDQFPTCKFIKDSHKNKRLIEKQGENVSSVLENVKAIKSSLKSLYKENYQEKLDRYDDILKQSTSITVKSSELAVKLHEAQTEIVSLKNAIVKLENDLADMRVRVSDNGDNDEIASLKQEISDITSDISNVDAERMALSETIGLLTSDIDKFEIDRKKYHDLIKQWRIYELFMSAVSKKGIPLQIITSQLPLINDEIAKILQGVVGFTVELEADAGSNDMHVYINYGDSRRIIECGSGMEKMMASLAIRVALINISSLPKTDMLIIDEGFGALDETNVEACNRLLGSLKKWFKNILVISHVDAVKDSVDNVLDITSEGKNAQVILE